MMWELCHGTLAWSQVCVCVWEAPDLGGGCGREGTLAALGWGMQMCVKFMTS